MKKSQFNFPLLKELCETPGVAGREERVRDLIRSEVKGLFDEITQDRLGSLICYRKARTKGKAKAPALKVMVCAHMDEIGFYVSHVDEKGFLTLDPAGGFDPRTLFSRRVLVVTESGDLVGALNPSGRTVHLSSAEERNKIPEIKSFYVDLGLDAAEVKKRVQIGDYVVMHEPTLQLGQKVMSKALDNRVACWVAIEAVREIVKSKQNHSTDIYAVFTTQEEVGIRGAKIAAHTVQPEVVLGLDVTIAADTPGVPTEERTSIQGAGYALHIKDSYYIADKALIEELETISKKEKIPYQRSILRGGGQDAAGVQQTGAGARAAAIMVPTRYVHTVTEMLSVVDLIAARDVVAAYLAQAKS